MESRSRGLPWGGPVPARSRRPRRSRPRGRSGTPIVPLGPVLRRDPARRPRPGPHNRPRGATGASRGGATSRPPSPAQTRPSRFQPARRPPGAEDLAGGRHLRWLLAIPDAIRHLEQLDRQLLTRRHIEQLFGAGKHAPPRSDDLRRRARWQPEDAHAHEAPAAAAWQNRFGEPGCSAKPSGGRSLPGWSELSLSFDVYRTLNETWHKIHGDVRRKQSAR